MDTQRVQEKPSLLFISGYVTRSPADYRAATTIRRAAQAVPGAAYHALHFPRREIQGRLVLPPFDEMVALAHHVAAKTCPDILIGHCTGASIALRLMHENNEIASSGAILVCPPVQYQGAVLQPWPRYRIFARSTGIPKFYVSKATREARQTKADAIRVAIDIFGDTKIANFMTANAGRMAVVTAARDNDCVSSAAQKWAEECGILHIELDDTHSIKQSSSASLIAAQLRRFLKAQSTSPR